MAECVLRERLPIDLLRCVELLRDVFGADGYPTFWPDDPAGWIASDREVKAWVACDGDAIIGHVAVHHARDDILASTWSEATGQPVDGLGVVARLFVSPERRNERLGSRLFDWAVAQIYDRQLNPVLDVAVDETDLLVFYERRGWTRIVETQVWMPNGIPFPVVALKGPAPWRDTLPA